MKIPTYTYISHTITKSIALGLLLSIAFFTASIQPAYAQQVNQQTNDLIPATFTFTKSLSKNMTMYPDVVYLKQLLNQDPRTAIATNPCISPIADGYFDQATKDAVIRFQNLYRGEVLSPAGARVATGVVGQYTRLKMNSLLRSPAYAGIIASSTPPTNQAQLQALQQAVNQYLDQVNQTLVQAQIGATTSTSSTTTLTSASSTNPAVTAYLNQVNQTLTLASNSPQLIMPQALATTSTTTAPSQGTSGISTGFPTSTNPAVNTYFQNLNNLLSNTTSTPSGNVVVNQTPNTNTANTSNNPVVTAYLNSINTTLGLSVATSATSTIGAQTPSTQNPTTTPTSTPPISSTNNALIPRILSVSPIQLSACQQTITIIGQNFSPTQNLLVGNLGTFVTTANTIATTSTSSIQAITLKLSDFTDYMYNQAIYAGQNREIRFTVMANGQTSGELVILRFTFPGEKRSGIAIAQTTSLTLAEGYSRININGGTTIQNSGTRNKSLIRSLEQVDPRIFSETPQGRLIAGIGGNRALETLYQFIPTGRLNQNIPGNIAGIVSMTNFSTPGTSNGSNNNGNGSSGGGALSGLAGIAAGIGIAAGVNAIFGGGASAAGAVGAAGIVGNFGGPLILNFPCTCSANSLITMQDVRGYPLQLIFQPGVSILYAYGVGILRPGAYLLGDYITAPMQCLVYAGSSCVPYGLPIGIIRQVGTSI